MKTYILKLKGTKKNNTPDLEVEVIAENKGQAFNFAYGFFQSGDYNSSSANIDLWIPKAKKLSKLSGKYFVPRSAIHIKK